MEGLGKYIYKVGWSTGIEMKTWNFFHLKIKKLSEEAFTSEKLT